jgi:hypothetical protein
MSQRKRKHAGRRAAESTSSRAASATAAPSGPATPAVPQVTATPAAPPPPAPASRPHPPAAAPDADWVARYAARAEARNAAARARILPLGPGEQPWPLRIAITLALVFSLGTLILMLAGVKVDHRAPSASWLLYVAVMFACAVGMWKHWFQAVLAFMCLLAIALVILSALLLRFSNLLGLIVPLVLIALGGTLFWKLVGVLGRIQMPQRPSVPAKR